MSLSDEELSHLFGRLDDGDLLGLWASLMTELNRRGVIRSDNNPIGDYCEFLVGAHYGVTPEGNSNAGHDVTAPDGSKIQVKGRRIRPDGRKPPHFSGVRNLADEPPPFDFLIGLILNRDFSGREAWRLPVERVRHYATYASTRTAGLCPRSAVRCATTRRSNRSNCTRRRDHKFCREPRRNTGRPRGREFGSC